MAHVHEKNAKKRASQLLSSGIKGWLPVCSKLMNLLISQKLKTSSSS
uniref:Uncharacterized protein n=1 Tax=Setaria italica TaxID=4555 RepID=K3YF24_SETIT